MSKFHYDTTYINEEATVGQKAEQWGCSTRQIYHWIKHGRVAARKLGSITVIDERAERPTPRQPGAGTLGRSTER